MNTVKRKNLIERMDLLLFQDSKPNFRSMSIILSILLITYVLCYILNIDDIDGIILLSGIFIGIFLSLPLPLYHITKFMKVFIILFPLVSFTVILSAIDPNIQVLIAIIWISFFIICNLIGSQLKAISFICVLYYLYLFHIEFGELVLYGFTLENILIALMYMFLTLFIVVIDFLPYMIYCYYRKDPVKKELLSSLFSKNINSNYNQVMKLLYDTGDIFTINMTHIALSLRSNNLTYDYLKKEVNSNNLIILEDIVDDILSDINVMIKTDNYSKIDTHLLENLSNNIRTNTADNIKICNLYNEYLKSFNRFNKVIDGDYLELKLYKKPNKIKKVFRKEFLSLENNKLRYGIQFTITFIIARFMDILLVDEDSVTISASALFTSKNELSYTINKVITRVFGNLMGLLFASIISYILILNHLTILLNILCVLSILLLFSFIPNHSDKTGFLVMALILFSTVTENYYVGIDRLIYVILGSFVSLTIGFFIFPINRKINLTEAIETKLSHVNNLLIDILRYNSINNELKEIFILNSKIDTHIERMKNTYNLNNQLEDMETLINTTNHLIELLINLKLSIKTENTNYEKIIKQTNNNFIKAQECIENNQIIKYEDYLDNINDIITNLEKTSNPEKVIILQYSRWIIEDMKIILNLINKSIENDTFNMLNKEL